MIAQFKSPTDFRKSLEARLKNSAQATGQDLQRLRRKVAFDRLLARIFHAEHSQFLLKGGYAMELRFEKARATRDIDLTYLERFENNSSSEVSKEIFLELRDISQINLQDFFVYQIGDVQLDLENAPYGGARYPVSSFIDGRLFVRFQLDIGLDIMVNHIDKIRGIQWLEFCGISSPPMWMITKEQQFAEKIHAYTIPRGGQVNSRVKDLVDLLLLLERDDFDFSFCAQALQIVFKVRGSHFIPDELLSPPDEWEIFFQKMATECGLNPNMLDAFKRVDRAFQNIACNTVLN